MNKQIKQNWRVAKCKLVRRSERKPSIVDAERTVYDVEVRDRAFHEISVTAFLAPESGIRWLGPEQEYYVENDGEIVGFRMRGGNVFWCESLTKDGEQPRSAKKEFDDLKAKLESSVTGFNLYDAQLGADPDSRSKRITDLRRTIKSPRFFVKEPFSSEVGNPKIVAVEIDNGQLKLDLTDEAGASSATVWIDIKTRKAIKAVEGAAVKK